MRLFNKKRNKNKNKTKNQLLQASDFFYLVYRIITFILNFGYSAIQGPKLQLGWHLAGMRTSIQCLLQPHTPIDQLFIEIVINQERGIITTNRAICFICVFLSPHKNSKYNENNNSRLIVRAIVRNKINNILCRDYFFDFFRDMIYTWLHKK